MSMHKLLKWLCGWVVRVHDLAIQNDPDYTDPVLPVGCWSFTSD
ncbi:MAG: hypothetical protein PHV43_03105 [Candidatus Colwellbacteria bacterium]|nr:hypothetical protein [Candidatus Colwellbacteria bacterium]